MLTRSTAMPPVLPLRRSRPWWRIVFLLLASVLLHGWFLGTARKALDFELPAAPPKTINVQLFKLPAPINVAAKAEPLTRRAAIRPPASVPKPAAKKAAVASAVPAAPPPVTPEAISQRDVETEPANTDLGPDANGTQAELAPSGSPNEPLVEPVPLKPVTPALESVIVSFPKLGRFTSDTQVSRGLLRLFGTTIIEWRVNGNQYQSNAETKDDSGRVYLTLKSEGEIRPSSGIAPLRYVEQRLSRAPVATNFQWDSGKVSFSASSNQYPLNEGTQDRLSFMAQLALLAQAFPQQFQPGSSIAFQVAGPRDVRVYDLRVVGWEAIRTELGIVDTLKLERAVTAGERETRLELWLAPKLRWLPARTRTTLPNDELIETVLREVYFEE